MPLMKGLPAIPADVREAPCIGPLGIVGFKPVAKAFLWASSTCLAWLELWVEERHILEESYVAEGDYPFIPCEDRFCLSASIKS